MDDQRQAMSSVIYRTCKCLDFIENSMRLHGRSRFNLVHNVSHHLISLDIYSKLNS